MSDVPKVEIANHVIVVTIALSAGRIVVKYLVERVMRHA